MNKSKIKRICDSINNICNPLDYVRHRCIQELLSEILKEVGYENTGIEPEEVEELIKQAIANCHLVNLYGIDPGMEEGMCAGLRTMSGKGEPCDTCQECRLQYQYAEEHS